jgi:hypothetical protein
MNNILVSWITTWFYFYLQKRQVMEEVMGSQSMVSIMLNLFLSKVKVSLYKPVYPILERERDVVTVLGSSCLDGMKESAIKCGINACTCCLFYTLFTSLVVVYNTLRNLEVM